MITDAIGPVARFPSSVRRFFDTSYNPEAKFGLHGLAAFRSQSDSVFLRRIFDTERDTGSVPQQARPGLRSPGFAVSSSDRRALHRRP